MNLLERLYLPAHLSFNSITNQSDTSIAFNIQSGEGQSTK